jgi:phospholipid/cholesterol/gamma-HCH transport system substrate-binding protein
MMSRMPERDSRADANKERSRFYWRPSNATIALIFLLIVTIGPYLAFTKHVPFTSYGYELNATFANGVNISKNSPVRIAGVEVGKVIGVEREGDATEVRFTVGGSGRPIHADAFAQIRPRIFLEGNFFIELDPGSPSSPEMDSGGTIPVSHTSTAVQLDEILTALQSPVRADLGHLLEGFGTALNATPTAAEDATQLPEVQGKSGGEALNGVLKYGGDAGRYGAQVTNAFLGTEPHDLSRLVAGTSRTFGAFVRREGELQELIVNFEVFTGALADQSENLEGTIRRFAPTLKTAQTSLVNLNRTLPPLRAFAIEFEPAVAELPDLIASAKPWLEQARPLVSGKEAGGIAKLLAEATPGLAGAAQEGKAVALPQLNRLSLCGSKVLLPTGEQTIGDQFSTGGPNYRELFYTLTDFAGQSQNFDGNGPYFRIQPGGGDILVGEPNPNGGQTTEKNGYAFTSTPPLGVQPQLQRRPPKKPGARCDKQPVPDVNSGPGQAGAPTLQVTTP